MNSIARPIVQRGDIYYADLGERLGSEQSGLRPVLIIQNNVGNLHSPTVIVSPLTSKLNKARMPTHVRVGARFGLTANSLILFEQIMTIDKQRLREYVGTADEQLLEHANRAIAISLGMGDSV